MYCPTDCRRINTSIRSLIFSNHSTRLLRYFLTILPVYLCMTKRYPTSIQDLKHSHLSARLNSAIHTKRPSEQWDFIPSEPDRNKNSDMLSLLHKCNSNNL